ncbi:MAG: hypothetical protein MI866_20325 [Bacteroidales bacterium]|nr:hypothetical protein [Bacteroidales bacterium]
MQAIKYFERLKQINELIKRQATGTPKQMSDRLGISVGYLHRLITEIKEKGAPICYCRQKQSYYYRKPFELRVNYSIEFISEDESRKINGGFSQKNTSLLFYVSEC